MSTLLYDLKASRLMNKTFFTHHLKIFDNVMVLERRKIPFHKEETTISYSHVSQVNLIKDLFFAHLEIINTGGIESILIRYVGKRRGKEAKDIIDAKIRSTHGVYAHNQHSDGGQQFGSDAPKAEDVIDDKALIRIKDLYTRGRLTKAEYNKLLDKYLRR